ncbi:hypothetical protein QR680_011486 [Steinernema hermaphroditum]|uniref:Uncharacterized protein n=1 Tax=Steinernema hermaphroditum TaxID=289476 RepID=A0AA39HZW6_9BILA|nr:hypothetical protein QR680_011486 [Steinernema hermaphroditum]
MFSKHQSTEKAESSQKKKLFQNENEDDDLRQLASAFDGDEFDRQAVASGLIKKLNRQMEDDDDKENESHDLRRH